MWNVSAMQCCGVKEIAGVRSAFVNCTPGTFDKFEQGLRTYLAPNFGVPLNAYFVFTAVVNTLTPLYGEAFKAFILANDLGTVIESTVNTNPNSSNPLKVYLWTLNLVNVRAWYANQPAAKRLETEKAIGVVRQNSTAPRAIPIIQ